MPYVPPGVVGGIVGAVATQKVVPGFLPGADAANTVIDGVAATRRWMSDRHNWMRLGWAFSGVVMVYAGVFLIARPAVTGAVGAAAKVVPMGKVAKVAGKVMK